MLVYKIDVLKELKEAGYSTYALRKENIVGQSTITKLNNGVMVSAQVLDTICRLLDLQPGNIIRYVPDETK